MKNIISVTKDVPIVGNFDVVVCGAGSAGWIAAVAAARLGCKTALVEKLSFFGGTATASFVAPISGFFLNEQQVVGGIPFEFVKKMESAGQAIFEMPRGHISYNFEYYKLLSQQMVLDAGVEIYSNSYLSQCIVENNKITTIVIENKNGSEAVSAKYFIDATGDGDLCKMANVEFLPVDIFELQPLSLCFIIDDVDTTTDLLKHSIHHNGKNGSSCNSIIRDFLNSAYEKKEIPQFGGPWFCTTVNGDALAVNVTRTGAYACNNRELRNAEFELRKNMFTLFNKLKDAYPEFKNSKIICSGFQAGVRETNNIKGYYTITGNDILAATKFEDTVALCAHPVDIHSSCDAKQQLIRLSKPAPVPFRAMISPKCDNVICAGRCISSDKVAHATIRVQATAMALGQAAGVAAYLAKKDKLNVSEISYKQLEMTLNSIGGITNC